MANKWMEAAKARMEKKGTVGSLRKEAGAKKGQDIPDSKLAALGAKAKKDGNGALAKKVAFAKAARKGS